MTTDDALEQLRRMTGDDTDPEAPEHQPALGWVDAHEVRTHSTPIVTTGPDLLSRRPRRPRGRVIIPVLGVLALVGAYAASTLLWPVESIPLTVTTDDIAPVAAPAATPSWPAEGRSGVGVDGIPGVIATSEEPASIASITKVVTALLVLDRMPLAIGEQGPSYAFTEADQNAYVGYLARDESALDVPVDGSLTEYQMLQGMLIGSASNYADRLATELWGSSAAFAEAANAWLAKEGLTDITIVDPTGIDPANVATPTALLALADRALADPVIAEIVRTRLIELPGVGAVSNTNDLLAGPAVVGIKTGSLEGEYNLLAAREVTVGPTVVRVYAVTLGQPDDETRDDATAELLDQTAADVSQPATVAAGTVVAVAKAPWGPSSQLITDAAASVALWNGATATTKPTIRIADDRAAGATVGSFTVTGPLDEATVPVRMTVDLPPPSRWWRLTHPLEVFGLTG